MSHATTGHLGAFSTLLAKDLRYTQNRAAFSGEDHVVVFDTEDDGYRVLDSAGDVVPAPFGGIDFVRDYGRDAVFRGLGAVVRDYLDVLNH